MLMTGNAVVQGKLALQLLTMELGIAHELISKASSSALIFTTNLPKFLM